MRNIVRRYDVGPLWRETHPACDGAVRVYSRMLDVT